MTSRHSTVLIAAFFTLAAVPVSAQERPAVIAPSDNLVVTGLPPIPAAIATQSKRYTDYRGVFVADWHPTQMTMLIARRSGNTVQLHQVAAPGAAPMQLTSFEEPVPAGSYEPRTGRYVVFGRDAGGNEFSQLYRYDLADRKATLLTDGGRSQNGGVVWSTAGNRIAYASTRRNGADRDLYVMDPADPATNRLVAEVSGGGWRVLAWSPDDRRLLAIELISVNRSNLWLIDVSSGQRTPLLASAPGDTTAHGGGAFGKEGHGIYLTTDRQSEFLRLVYVDLATGSLTPLTADLSWDVEDFALSPDGKSIAFMTNEAGISRLYLLDTQTRKYHPAAGVPVGIIGGLIWHKNGRDLGFAMSNARSPGDAYSLNAATGKLTRWADGDLGGVTREALAEPTLINWKSFDGLDLTGFYYRAPSRFTGKRPVIVNIHGGPEGQSRPGYLGNWNFYLNELGVSMIYPNVRGSTGYGKTFVKLDNGFKRMDTVKDIGALLDWIGRQPELDPNRVLVTGGSYGGFMTLAVATTYNDRITCSVDVVGPSNFNTFLKNTESYRRDLRRVEYGDERDPAMFEFLERIAPLNNAAKITKPLFVIQGGNDPRVPRTESEQMVARVTANGSPVWYLLAKDEGHGFRKKNNVDFQFYATVMFSKRYLLGEPMAGATP